MLIFDAENKDDKKWLWKRMTLLEGLEIEA
jgi:hypothetical protein